MLPVWNLAGVHQTAAYIHMPVLPHMGPHADTQRKLPEGGHNAMWADRRRDDSKLKSKGK